MVRAVNDCPHPKAIRMRGEFGDWPHWRCISCGLPVKLDRQNDQWVPVKP